MVDWEVSLSSYIQSDTIFTCQQVAEGESSYLLNPKLPGTNLDKINNAESLPIFFDSVERHLDGRNVAFADGHVKWCQPSVWKSDFLPQMREFVPDLSPSRE